MAVRTSARQGLKGRRGREDGRGCEWQAKSGSDSTFGRSAEPTDQSYQFLYFIELTFMFSVCHLICKFAPSVVCSVRESYCDMYTYRWASFIMDRSGLRCKLSNQRP